MTLAKDPRSDDDQFYTHHAIGEALGFDFPSTEEGTFRSQLADILGIATQDGGHGVSVPDLITMVNHALTLKSTRNEEFDPRARILTWDRADWMVPERAYLVERRTDFIQPFVDAGMVTSRSYTVPEDTVAVALTPVTAAGNALRKEVLLSPITLELRGTFDTIREDADPVTVRAVVSGHQLPLVYDWGIAGGVGTGFVALAGTRTSAVTITPQEVFGGATHQDVRIFLNVQDGDGHRANAEFAFRVLNVAFDFDIVGPPMSAIRETESFNYGYVPNIAAPRPMGRFTSSWRFIRRAGGPVLGVFDGNRFTANRVTMNEAGEVEATVTRERSTGNPALPFLPVDTVTKRQTVFVIDDPAVFNNIPTQTVRPGEVRVINLNDYLRNPQRETVDNWRVSESIGGIVTSVSDTGRLTVTGGYRNTLESGIAEVFCDVGGVEVRGTVELVVRRVEIDITGPTSINEGTSVGQQFQLSTNIWDINAVGVQSSVWSVDALPLQIISQTRTRCFVRTQLITATVLRAVTVTVTAGGGRTFSATKSVSVVDVPPTFDAIPAITLDPGESRSVNLAPYINTRPGESTRNWQAGEQPTAQFNGVVDPISGSTVTVRAGHPTNGSSSGFVAVAVEVGSATTGYVRVISEFRVTVRQWTIGISGSTLDLPDTNPNRSFTATTNSRNIAGLSWAWSLNVPANVATLVNATRRTVSVDPQNVSNNRFVRLSLTVSIGGTSLSTSVTFNITDNAPANPSNLRTANLQWRQVNLLWNAGTGGGPVLRYEYRVLLSPGGFSAWVNSGLSRNVLLSFLTLSQTPGGRNFRWQVRAVASNGETSGIVNGPSLTVPAEPRPNRPATLSVSSAALPFGYRVTITATPASPSSTTGRTFQIGWRWNDGTRWSAMAYHPASISTSPLGTVSFNFTNMDLEDGDTIRIQAWAGGAGSTRPSSGIPQASAGWSGFREQSHTI